VGENAQPQVAARKEIERSGGGTAKPKHPLGRASEADIPSAGSVEQSTEIEHNLHTKQKGGMAGKILWGATKLALGAAGFGNIQDVIDDHNAAKGAKAENAVAGLMKAKGLAGKGFSKKAKKGTTGKLKKKAETKELTNPATEKDKDKDKKKKPPTAAERAAGGITGGGSGYTGGKFGAANAYHGTTTAVSSVGYSGKGTGLGSSKGAQLVSRVGGPRKLGK
jgi:hypothetical protein